MDRLNILRPSTNTGSRRKFVLIITDSRGSWLHSKLYHYQDNRIKYQVIYRKGAGLRKLWETVEWAILTRPVDLIILMGGVCDMTEKFYVGSRRFFWPLDDLDKIFRDISNTMKDIARNYRLLSTACKLVFLPDPGVDLIRLNKIPHPVSWTELIVQEELEENLDTLHLYTRALNSYMGSRTPWSLDVTHAHRNHALKPVYDRFRDGLHFSGEQVEKLAHEIDRYSRESLNLVCCSKLLRNTILNLTIIRLAVFVQHYIRLPLIDQCYLLLTRPYSFDLTRTVTSSDRQRLANYDDTESPYRPPTDFSPTIISSDYQFDPNSVMMISSDRHTNVFTTTKHASVSYHTINCKVENCKLFVLKFKTYMSVIIFSECYE